MKAALLLAAVGVAVAVLSTTRPSPADQPPPPIRQPVAVDLNRLGEELDLFAADARHVRWANALAGLSAGSVLLPAGIVLLGRSDGVSEALVIGLIVGGSAQLISVPLAFIPTRMDGVRDDFRERRARDADSAATVHAVEDEWRDAAATSRRFRKVGGTIMTIAGVLHLVTGLVFVLAPAGIFGLDRKEQYVWGGSLIGVGTSVGAIGVRLLMVESTEETSWNTYQLMTSRSTPSPVSLGIAPIPGGSVAVVGLSF